jgi:hypothetical protein
MRTIYDNLIFHEDFGGLVTVGGLDGEIQPYEGDLYEGMRTCIGPFQCISRECWGACGMIEKNRRTGKWFLRFDEPRKSVGAVVTGLHVESRHVVG